MLAARVVMGPVDGAAILVPFVLAAELDHITDLERRNARCDVDVVRDEQRLAGVQAQDEALVPIAVVVVRERSIDFARADNSDAALMRRERIGYDPIARRDGRPPAPDRAAASQQGRGDEEWEEASQDEAPIGLPVTVGLCRSASPTSRSVRMPSETPRAETPRRL